MSVKIKVIIKRPGVKPYATNITDSLKNLQRTVDGYIETVTLAENLVLICNEEGRIRKLPYNCNIMGLDFYGTLIFAGIDGENFGDIPYTFKAFKTVFKSLFEEVSNG